MIDIEIANHFCFLIYMYYEYFSAIKQGKVELRCRKAYSHLANSLRDVFRIICIITNIQGDSTNHYKKFLAHGTGTISFL